MNEITEKFIRKIFECEYKILFPNSHIEVSQAILLKDNFVKALIDVYGEEKYLEFRKELTK